MTRSGMCGWAGSSLSKAPSWQGWPLAKPCPLGVEYIPKRCLFLNQKNDVKRVAVTLLTSILVTKFDWVPIICKNCGTEMDITFVAWKRRTVMAIIGLKNTNEIICLMAPTSELSNTPTIMWDLHIVFNNSLPQYHPLVLLSVIHFGTVVWSIPI